ncbi:MAG: hypothetical protein ACR2NP_00335 [Pirellulaceae bacterium]
MSTVTVGSSSANKLVATCPACNTRYKIKPFMSGKRARCGKCQTKMRIPTLRAKLNEVTSTAKRKIVAAIPGMRGTGMGLLLGAWGTIIMLVAIVAAVTALIMSNYLPVPFEYLRLAIGISLLGGALMTIVGMFGCACVPKQSGARGWISSAIIFTIANMAIVGYTVYCAIERMAPVIDPMIIQYITMGLGVMVFFSFMMFMKKTSDFTARPELTGTAKGIMWFQALIIAVVIGMISLSVTLSPGASTALLLQVIGWGVLIAALINQVIMIVLEFQLGSHLRRR